MDDYRYLEASRTHHYDGTVCLWLAPEFKMGLVLRLITEIAAPRMRGTRRTVTRLLLGIEDNPDRQSDSSHILQSITIIRVPIGSRIPRVSFAGTDRWAIDARRRFRARTHRGARCGDSRAVREWHVLFDRVVRGESGHMHAV